MPYVGEIRMFGAALRRPDGRSAMDLLQAISENEVLFTLIGTTYGGDGESTSRCQTCWTGCRCIRAPGLSWDNRPHESVTLTFSKFEPQPPHGRDKQHIQPADVANNVVAQSSTGKLYIEIHRRLRCRTLRVPGWRNQPHDNMQPTFASV